MRREADVLFQWCRGRYDLYRNAYVHSLPLFAPRCVCNTAKRCGQILRGALHPQPHLLQPDTRNPLPPSSREIGNKAVAFDCISAATPRSGKFRCSRQIDPRPEQQSASAPWLRTEARIYGDQMPTNFVPRGGWRMNLEQNASIPVQ